MIIDLIADIIIYLKLYQLIWCGFMVRLFRLLAAGGKVGGGKKKRRKGYAAAKKAQTDAEVALAGSLDTEMDRVIAESLALSEVDGKANAADKTMMDLAIAASLASVDVSGNANAAVKNSKDPASASATAGGSSSSGQTKIIIPKHSFLIQVNGVLTEVDPDALLKLLAKAAVEKAAVAKAAVEKAAVEKAAVAKAGEGAVGTAAKPTATAPVSIHSNLAEAAGAAPTAAKPTATAPVSIRSNPADYANYRRRCESGLYPSLTAGFKAGKTARNNNFELYVANGCSAAKTEAQVVLGASRSTVSMVDGEYLTEGIAKKRLMEASASMATCSTHLCFIRINDKYLKPSMSGYLGTGASSGFRGPAQRELAQFLEGPRKRRARQLRRPEPGGRQEVLVGYEARHVSERLGMSLQSIVVARLQLSGSWVELRLQLRHLRRAQRPWSAKPPALIRRPSGSGCRTTLPRSTPSLLRRSPKKLRAKSLRQQRKSRKLSKWPICRGPAFVL